MPTLTRKLSAHVGGVSFTTTPVTLFVPFLSAGLTFIGRPRAVEQFLQLAQRRGAHAPPLPSVHDETQRAIQAREFLVHEGPRQLLGEDQPRDADRCRTPVL
ncbi:MAG TPA: hypothetical protein PLX31_14720, partial [Gemmatimonadaceae bacterium]|nr:hypothetical protein [Gemmatimonadaceae bacterium]